MRPAHLRRRWPAAAALLATITITAAGSSAAADPPLMLVATLGADAQPSRPSPLRFRLRLAPRPAPVTSIAVSYPAEIGIASSGLGLAGCDRPPSSYAAVLITEPATRRCPTNSILGRGTAIARVTVGSHAIPAHALVTLLAGPVADRSMRLTAFVNGTNPFGVALIFAGELGAGETPATEQIAVTLPQIPDLAIDAAVSLALLDLTIGGRDIIYSNRNRRWRPGGVTLPATCPAPGWRFATLIAYADGARQRAEAIAPCPVSKRAAGVR